MSYTGDDAIKQKAEQERRERTARYFDDLEDEKTNPNVLYDDGEGSGLMQVLLSEVPDGAEYSLDGTVYRKPFKTNSMKIEAFLEDDQIEKESDGEVNQGRSLVDDIREYEQSKAGIVADSNPDDEEEMVTYINEDDSLDSIPLSEVPVGGFYMTKEGEYRQKPFKSVNAEDSGLIRVDDVPFETDEEEAARLEAERKAEKEESQKMVQEAQDLFNARVKGYKTKK